ncbi:exodeoxyribonuclease VII large subunit [Lachnospiraceae bacterium KM106-2]|nr:exodeoxyribonuclease VII large subunit [Lachnospiraceae bacterium KM106-2]
MSEGQSVIVLGSVSVYERDGKYQIYAREIMLDGLGNLYAKYEQLKKELEETGLFDPSHKKRIPYYSSKVGIVTASTGAAIQDIINIATRRNPYVQLILYPALVQGEGAKASIVKGIKKLDEMELDVIIVGRGGGSIEDLWAFNEEVVAQAIYQCKTPIVSAVGHETDTTIADYVADMRAPTPSAAAEITVRDIREVMQQIESYSSAMNQRLRNKISIYRYELERKRMKLEYASPVNQIQQKRQYLIHTEEKMNQLMEMKVKDKRHKLAIYIEKMKGLSPLDKLNHGYAIAMNEEGNTISSIKQAKTGEKLTIAVKDGDIITTVESKVTRRRK